MNFGPSITSIIVGFVQSPVRRLDNGNRDGGGGGGDGSGGGSGIAALGLRKSKPLLGCDSPKARCTERKAKGEESRVVDRPDC